MSAVTDDRCDYQLEVGLADQDLSAEPCGRPVWEDHDRCVWHAKVNGKPIDVLEAARPKSGETLDGAYLREAELVGVDWLAGASLVGADFTDARLNGSDFSEADLMLATLTNASGINADFRGANLEGAIFKDADLRRATLEYARLYETILTNVHIGDDTALGDRSVYEQANVQPVLSNDNPLEAASWVYRQLQQIYQQNAHPKLARQSYIQEKDSRRRLAWDRTNYGEAIRWELSRWVMRYGSSSSRILLTSLTVIVVAAVLYPLTGGVEELTGDQAVTFAFEDPGDASQWWIGTVLFKSLYFSVITFATLGYGDIRPVGEIARLIAGVESLFGALLAALLVFVLARNVTW
ncbi:pentapeptide repeat-containing protein [Halobaculum rarum]|uniref:pentapeptide repeat-containing protein n=1 Tax=Halobaculum rarum TaxID=3075122 RepID=UPI0032AFB80C